MVKLGLEIHQRLDGKKLFCDCICSINDEEAPRLTITRRLHPVFSELGEVDEASQAEFAKDRIFEYQVFSSNNCLIETDEEPPKTLNEDALRFALSIAMQLNASPVGEVHVMRKMVIDGSNTSGFQRTSIVALGGHLDTSKGRVGIPQIAIEEESAGIISGGESRASYRLDRLGIPLIEISTDPDIKDGEHLSEVAEKLGLMLRTSGRVARGLGTIRQDVNVSTEGGARVEIKGAQDLKMLPTLVEYEVKRQTALVSILLELRAKNALPVKKHPKDATEIFRGTKAKMIASGMDSGSVVIAQKLLFHKGVLGKEIQPGRRYGTELSDYAKRAGVKGLIHSDENLEKYGISKDEVQKLEKALEIYAGDAFIMVVAPKDQAEKAVEYALLRANMDYVPKETRRANPDGTSSYMRPLPGRARLYPETDVPPLPLSPEFLAAVQKGESLEDRKSKLEKILNKEMSVRMLKSRNLHLFEKLVAGGAEPMLAATTLEDTIVSLRREGVELGDLEKALTDLFSEFSSGSFVKAAIPEVLKGMAKGARAEAVVKVYRLQRITGDELKRIAEECGNDLKIIMQKYRLQVDPAEAAGLIKKKK
jgi:glutamyl-tRNA(Gln) amidotransferase subunit E